MNKFLLDNEDFESKIVDMPDNLSRLQILKLDGGDYAVIKLIDQRAFELGIFAKDEFKLLWETLNDTPHHLEYAQYIIEGICRYYKISIEDLIKKTRGVEDVRRRKLTMYIYYINTHIHL